MTELIPSRLVNVEDAPPAPPALPQYGALAVLDVPVEWMRFCPSCESVQRFVADREAAIGLVGSCSGCGAELFAPFSRATSDAA